MRNTKRSTRAGIIGVFFLSFQEEVNGTGYGHYLLNLFHINYFATNRQFYVKFDNVSSVSLSEKQNY